MYNVCTQVSGLGWGHAVTEEPLDLCQLPGMCHVEAVRAHLPAAHCQMTFRGSTHTS